MRDDSNRGEGRRWCEASKDLGIRFTSPFPFERDGKTFEALFLVREFGRRIGTVISVIDEPSSSVGRPRSEDYLVSQLSIATHAMIAVFHQHFRRLAVLRTRLRKASMV